MRIENTFAAVSRSVNLAGFTVPAGLPQHNIAKGYEGFPRKPIAIARSYRRC